MNTQEILDHLAIDWPDVLLADGFEDALLGVACGGARPGVACYDFDQCLEILMRRDGMSEDDARDYLEFNTLGANLGEMTPLFLHDWRDRPK